jgi:hypothetical protein
MSDGSIGLSLSGRPRPLGVIAKTVGMLSRIGLTMKPVFRN